MTDLVQNVPWNDSAFNDGLMARIEGRRKDQCPSAEAIGEFARKSWLAGWADADTNFAINPQQWDTLRPSAQRHP